MMSLGVVQLKAILRSNLTQQLLQKKTLGVMVLPYDSNEIASEVFPLAPSLRHEAELRDLYKKATKSLHG